MVDDIARRYGKAPDRLLIDTSYATSEDIIALERAAFIWPHSLSF
jgi:hypothetical protein